MKARVFLSAAALCFCLCLCACSPETKIVGTWSLNSGADPTDMGFPFDSAVTWTFRSDHTATAEIPVADGGVDVQEYGYTMTDDTLTLTTDEISYGILYELDGDTLTLNPSMEVPGVFTRD